MSIIEVPVLPFRAGRHLAAWIVWHTARVSLVEDVAEVPTPARTTKRTKARKS
jgi:hypothetical protein